MDSSKISGIAEIAGFLLLFLVWPSGIIAVLVGYATSSIILGVVAYVATFCLLQIYHRVSDIHRWTKRINGSVETEEISRRQPWSISIGPFRITRERD